MLSPLAAGEGGAWTAWDGMGRDGRWPFAAMVMVVVGARDEGLVRGLFGVCWVGCMMPFFLCVRDGGDEGR